MQLTTLELERIEQGQSVCLQAIAFAWAERKIALKLASYLQVNSLASWLAAELQIAVRNGRLNVFDVNRGKERAYRVEDEPELAKLRVWLLPESVDAWLGKEGIEPALTASAPFTSESVEQRGLRYLSELEEEMLNGTRGALQRLANRLGVDRSNLGKDIKKARSVRSEKLRAGDWSAQLMKGGARKP